MFNGIEWDEWLPASFCCSGRAKWLCARFIPRHFCWDNKVWQILPARYSSVAHEQLHFLSGGFCRCFKTADGLLYSVSQVLSECNSAVQKAPAVRRLYVLSSMLRNCRSVEIGDPFSLRFLNLVLG